MSERLENRRIVRFFVFLAFLFIFSAFAGYFHAYSDPASAQSFFQMLSSELGFIKDLDPLLVLAIILINNSGKGLLVALAGFLFGIAPILFIVLNGYIIGLIVYVVGLEKGIWQTALFLLPHGILEIPGILLACSYGLWLGNRFFRATIGEEGEISMVDSIKEVILNYMKFVFPVLLIAAFVEVFITPIIAGI